MSNFASLIAAASTGGQIGLGFGQAQQNAQAAELRGRFANDVAERNARLAEKQGADAENRGALEENRLRGETDQTVSTGRAAAAAGGADVNVGSAAAVTASERLVGNVDALTIRNNAAREAWGYDVEAANERMQGKLALLAGKNEAAADRVASYGTLLSGAASVYGLGKLRVPGTNAPSTLTTQSMPSGRRIDSAPYGSSGTTQGQT